MGKELNAFKVNGKMAYLGTEVTDRLKLKSSLTESYLSTRGLSKKFDYDVIDTMLLNSRFNKSALCNSRKQLVLYKTGLERLLSHKRQSEAIELAKLVNIDLSYIKEREFISIIKESFSDFKCIQQFVVDRDNGRKFYCDLYIHHPSNKFSGVVVECDELGHIDRDCEDEIYRELYIKEKLDCQFVRFNPDDKDFSIGKVINQIRVLLDQNTVSKETDIEIMHNDIYEDIMKEDICINLVKSYIHEYIESINFNMGLLGYSCDISIQESYPNTYVICNGIKIVNIKDIFTCNTTIADEEVCIELKIQGISYIDINSIINIKFNRNLLVFDIEGIKDTIKKDIYISKYLKMLNRGNM